MKRVGEMLGEAIGRNEVLRTARAQRTLQQWPEVVGQLLVEHAKPDRYERGTLWVLASGSAWAQEVSLYKETILERLNVAADEANLFQDLKVSISPKVRRRKSEASKVK